jgi:O-antigen/teichoic acid export membrane protein
VVDQAASSLSNFVLAIVVANALGPRGFGAFSLAYLTYAFVLSATRGIATDPLLVRLSGPETPAWRRGVASAAGTSLVTGVLAGGVCVLIGLLVLPPSLGPAFIALGAVLPAVLLQDCWRFAFFAVGRPVQALLNDVVWGGLQLLAVTVLLLTGRSSVVVYLLAFGGSAAVAAGVGLWQTGIRPRPRLVGAWLREHRALGRRYLVENVAIGGARQVRFYALGAIVGLSAVGEVRAAEILMGPFLVMLMGVSQVAVPEGVQVLAGGPARLRRYCFWVGACQAGAAAAWGALVLVVLPWGLGELLLGPLWQPAAALLPPVLIGMVLGAFEIGAAAGVRALGAARRSLAAQLTNAALYVSGGVAGAVVDGARGSCWGVAMATLLGALTWWWQLDKALGEHVPASDAADVPSLEHEGMSS